MGITEFNAGVNPATDWHLIRASYPCIRAMKTGMCSDANMEYLA